VHPDDRGTATVRWNVAVASGTIFDEEFRIRRSDGIFRKFKSRAVPLRDDDGVIRKWFGTSTDLEGPPADE
jgi:PAS domain-containing protein